MATIDSMGSREEKEIPFADVNFIISFSGIQSLFTSYLWMGNGNEKREGLKNYGSKFSQLQDIRGRETGINIDTRFMKFKIH